MSDREVIESGELTLGLAPEAGGSVSFFRFAGVDLMRPLSTDDRAKETAIGAAMFPMVPYANRIAGNEFDFDGRTYRFQPNNPPEKFNVHGTGWQLPWRFSRPRDGEALLEVTHLAPDEPYSYAAWQRFTLTAKGLAVETGIENRGERPMPFGFGQHPGFPRDPDTELSFAANVLWVEGWDNTASERIATPPEFSFANWRGLPRARRNNCYGGWDGKVGIRWPSRGLGLRIEADPIFRHLMFYAGPALSAFCLEPQTNSVCAFNMPEEQAFYDLGTIVLAPGEHASGVIRFLPFRIGE